MGITIDGMLVAVGTGVEVGSGVDVGNGVAVKVGTAVKVGVGGTGSYEVPVGSGVVV